MPLDLQIVLDDQRTDAGRLRELRVVAGWSRDNLAEASGVGAAAIRDIEQGRRIPGWGTVLALAGALGVTPDSFTLEPTPPRPLPQKPEPVEPPKRGRPRKVEPPAKGEAPAVKKVTGPARKRRKTH